MSSRNNKILIAYFSRKGQNYRGGSIVNLPIGNTEVLAKMIHEQVGGDLFEIKTTKQYPIDYTETTEVAKAELRANARPELTGTVNNIDDYDVVYLGYPNWWNTFPMAVSTFLESNDFSGKTIIPFCTHEGSGLGNSERDMKKLCSNSTVLKGIAIKGSHVNSAQKEISDWLTKL